MRFRALPVVAVGLTVWLARADAPRPSNTEAAGEVERTRSVAANYTKRLPDFVCIQTIRRSYHLTLPKNWIPSDTLTLKLRYAGQTEDRQLIARNGQPVAAGEAAGGLENIGEFGGMLEGLFDRSTQAEFHWDSWKTVHGRAITVFSYRVAKEHSSYMLSFDPGGFVHRAVVGYHGTIEVDRESGEVLRLVYESEDVPNDFPMQSASTTVDYDYIEVAGKRYLLPVHAEIETSADGIRSRNISDFTEYRKFSSDSTITFGEPTGNQ